MEGLHKTQETYKEHEIDILNPESLNYTLGNDYQKSMEFTNENC